jgi:hypothetical protein
MDFRPLLEAAKPLEERRKLFNDGVSELGALDAQSLSYRMKVPPQVVTAYYELNNVSEAERKLLASKNLDIDVLGALLNIAPENRAAVYGQLDQFLVAKFPVASIVNFVNRGAGRMTIGDLYQRVDRKFWGKVATILYERGLERGSMTKQFRSLLVNVTRYEASPKQLEWLERGIRTDFDEGLGVFSTPSLQKEFPEAVGAIGQFCR